MRETCGTCKFMQYKPNKYGDTKEGYCYGNPPTFGLMRPKSKTGDHSCSLYVIKESLNEAVS